MKDKICGDCSWVRQISAGKHSDYVCMNPKNDVLWDYFNQSTGDVVRNNRKAQSVLYDHGCQHFDKVKGVK